MKIISQIYYKLNKISLFYKLLILLILLFTIRHIFLINNTLIYGEESARLITYSSIAKGEVLYKDVGYWHGILPPYFFGAIFKIFGAELIYVRIISLIFVLISILVLYNIGTLLVPEIWAAFTAFMALCVYFSVFYSYGYSISNCMGYTGLLFLILFIFKNKTPYFYLSILFLSLTTLNNFYIEGFAFNSAVVLSLAIYWSVQKKIKGNVKYIIKYIFGIILLFFIFNSYFILTLDKEQILSHYSVIGGGNLESPFKVIFERGIFNFFGRFIEFLPASFTINEIYFSVKRIFYLVFGILYPIIVFFYGLFFYLKNKDNLKEKSIIILLFAFLSLFMPVRTYFFGPGGTMDAFYIAPSVFLCLILLYYKYKSLTGFLYKYKKIVKYSVIAFILLIYMFIQIPNFNTTYAKVKLDYKGVKGIKVGPSEAEFIDQLVDITLKYTDKDDKIMSLGSEIVSFITGREIFGKDNLLYFYPFAREFEKLSISREKYNRLKEKLISRVNAEKPKLIFLHYANKDQILKNLPEFADILELKYELKKTVGKYVEDQNVDFHKLNKISVYVLKDKITG